MFELALDLGPNLDDLERVEQCDGGDSGDIAGNRTPQPLWQVMYGFFPLVAFHFY